MKTILLTGATGFLGSHLLEALILQGYNVTILKRSTSDTWRIDHLLSKVIAHNIDRVPLEEAFKNQQIDAVIHTACSYGRNGETTCEVVETNLLFGLRLVDAAISFNTDTFFNTDTLLPKHLNTYALSKNQFTEWLRQRCQQLKVVNLKPEHMYGPKDDSAKFVPWLICQLRQNVGRIALTTGHQLRDFTYIDDVVSAYLLALEKATDLPMFNEIDIGTGRLISVREFVIALLAEHKIRFPDNKSVLGFGDVPTREGELMSAKVDNKELVQWGWIPKISPAQGIARLYRDFK